MATKTPAAVSLDDLVAAFEFVSFDGQAEHRAYICTDTGTIHYLTDDPKLNEGVPEDIEESDQYIAVPDKRELDLGRDQVFAFVARELPDEWDTVRDLFRRRGAYRRLKDFLQTTGMLEKWYQFEQKSSEDALRSWCGENEIPVREP